MKFNEKLIELRKRAGLSQEELGERLNVTRQTISKWELGQTTPEMSKLTEIANLFNISVDDLLKEDKIQSINTNTESENNNKTENNNRNAIIVGILLIILIALLVGIIYVAVTSINKNNGQKEIQNNTQGIFDKATNMIESVTDTIQNEFNNINEQKDVIKNEIIDKSESIRNTYNEQVEKQKKESEIKSFNSTFEHLYSGKQSKFFVESAINKVVQNNMKNEKIISVKYNNIVAKTSDELSELLSKLNKSNYFITYDYDSEGFISQMNIKDI